MPMAETRSPVRPSSRYIMFGDSGRRLTLEEGVFCAPEAATDPAAATVAVFRKSLRSMKSSSQGSFVDIDTGGLQRLAEASLRMWRAAVDPVTSTPLSVSSRSTISSIRKSTSIRSSNRPKRPEPTRSIDSKIASELPTIRAFCDISLQVKLDAEASDSS
jgi:hypothetical protein